ncbi:MAG: PEP-CTERM sorting domain-containing protein [Phycisphaerales bacterium]
MKMTKLFGISVATLGLALACTAPASANLLTNPGFETTPLVDDGSGVGKWQPFGGTGVALPTLSATDSTLPLSGASHLSLQLDNIVNSFAGVFQDVGGLTAGEQITWSGWTMDLGADAGGAEIRIEWRDSVNNVEITRTANLVPTLTPNVYTQWSLTDVVPAGADTARVVYAIQSFGAGPNQWHYVDDTSVTPEPASMALLGLGGLAMLRRRA